MSFYVPVAVYQGTEGPGSTLKAVFLGESCDKPREQNGTVTQSPVISDSKNSNMGVNKNALNAEDCSPFEKSPLMKEESFQYPASPVRLNTEMRGQGKAYGLMSRFPKIEDMPHFHYDSVEFRSPITMNLYQNQITDTRRYQKEINEGLVMVQVECQGRSWVIKRCYEDFKGLDKRLHKCVFTRRFSQLEPLPDLNDQDSKPISEELRKLLVDYLTKLSSIADQRMTCGPVLNWLEVDNHGNHMLLSDDSAINVPALAAARVVRRYTAQVYDELSLEVDDFVSVIDMPPVDESLWWRGKLHFQVGFFPSNCVEVIGGEVHRSSVSSIQKVKPVAKKRGKVISFLRAFLSSRPSRARLMQRGILRERVFGCDLAEHLEKTKREIPLVLELCAGVIEKHGIVDGIYRLSGMNSNIQKLRLLFDSDQIPDLTKECYLHDVHCISSLCKMYFRELPNPLLTFHLYDKFSEAIQLEDDTERIIAIHHVVQQLPPPHYRTLEFLLRHLYGLAQYSSMTAMTIKNLAIVWAPNLLRCKSVDLQLLDVRVQAVVTEYLITNVNTFFDKDEAALVIAMNPRFSASFERRFRERAKSVPNKEIEFLKVETPYNIRPLSVGLSPTPKLISLEEARARCYTSPSLPTQDSCKFIEVGGGPGALPAQYHTIVDITNKKKTSNGSAGTKMGRWKSLFTKRSNSIDANARPPPRRGKFVRQLSGPQGYPCTSEQSHLNRENDCISEELSVSEPAMRHIRSAGDFTRHIDPDLDLDTPKRRTRVQSETIWFTHDSLNDCVQDKQHKVSTGSSTPVLNSALSDKPVENVFFVDSEEERSSESSDSCVAESPGTSPTNSTGQPYSPRRPHSLHEVKKKAAQHSESRKQRHSSPMLSVNFQSVPEENIGCTKQSVARTLSSDNTFVITGTPVTMIETSLQ